MRTLPLTEVSTRELRPLLQEESEHWQEDLLWDYSDVSAAVVSGLERRALSGFVLRDGAGSEIIAHVDDEARPNGIGRGAAIWATWEPTASRLLPPRPAAT